MEYSDLFIKIRERNTPDAHIAAFLLESEIYILMVHGCQVTLVSV
jgi:hypothetical protein